MPNIDLRNIDYIELLNTIQSHTIDFVCIDPPYDLKISSNKNTGCLNYVGKIKNGLDKIKDSFDYEFCFSEVERVCKKMNLICFCSNSQISQLMKWGEDRGYITTLLVWHKKNMPPFTKGTWKQDLEFIVHIRQNGATFNDCDSYLKSKIYVSNYEISKFGHPTEKPLKLIKRFLEVCSNENDLVLDCFMGSGTTAAACKDMNRDFIGCDNNKGYFERATKRLNNHNTQLLITL